MHHKGILVLCLALLAPAVRAQEAPDAGTAHVPKDSPFCVRLPSLDRVEEIRKDVVPLLAAIDELDELAEKSLLDVVREELGVDAAWIDTTKPIYLGGVDDPVLVFPAKAGTALDGVKELKRGHQAVQRGGFIVVGEPQELEKETRGAPVELLAGDIVVHAFLSELVDRNKESIEQGFQSTAQMLAFSGLPAAVLPLIEPMLSVGKAAVFGAGPFTYALTWKGDHAVSEGYFATRPDSSLRAFFGGVGTGGANDLAGYLPSDALMISDAVLDPTWPYGPFEAFAEKAFGEGVGKALSQVFGPTYAVAPKLTGRSATAMRMQGMMGSSSLGIFELKEGVDAATIFEGYDVAVGNAALKKLGAPLSFTLEKDVTKHGETPLHRMTMQSEEPALAMLTMMFQSYFAAEGRHLFVTQGMTAESDMKSLIDSVRSGTKKEGAHARAMARLGPERNMGITLNVGALKPMAGMFMMVDPQVAQFFAGFPDEMYTSTAISITREGNLRWKGDWPVKQILDLVNAAAAAQKKAEEAPADEEFD